MNNNLLICITCGIIILTILIFIGCIYRRRINEYFGNNKNFIFSSVGDNTNFDNIWFGDNMNYDVYVIYYGDNIDIYNKYKSKVNQARRIDDIRYLKERPAREKEGIYSASVGRKDSAISKTLDFHDNKDAKDDGIRNFEKPTAYHTAYDEVQRLKK